MKKLTDTHREHWLRSDAIADARDRAEMRGEVEDIALRFRHRIEPAAAIVNDDDDLTFAAAVLDRLARALLQVDLPACFLQEGHTEHLPSQLIDIFLFHDIYAEPAAPAESSPFFGWVRFSRP